MYLMVELKLGEHRNMTWKLGSFRSPFDSCDQMLFRVKFSGSTVSIKTYKNKSRQRFSSQLVTVTRLIVKKYDRNQ